MIEILIHTREQSFEQTLDRILKAQDSADRKLAQVLDLLALVSTKGDVMPALDTLRAKIAALQEDVTTQVGVNQSAVTLLNGLSAMISGLKDQVTALQDQVAAGTGLTEADLQPLADQVAALDQTLDESTPGLASAVAANNQNG